MPHHVIQEQDLKHQCLYCRNDAGDNWNSEFSRNTHYKIIECTSCGHKNSLKVDFDGSGHDDWSGNNKWEEKLKRQVEERLKHKQKDKFDELVNQKHREEFTELIEEEFRYLEETKDDLLSSIQESIEEVSDKTE